MVRGSHMVPSRQLGSVPGNLQSSNTLSLQYGKSFRRVSQLKGLQRPGPKRSQPHP